MISAGLFGTLLFHPGSPVARALPDPLLRRALMGAIMGLTAIGLIYSPWGQQSGAHLNPAVTLTFWRLGKVATWDALFYVLAQFVGGALGVLLVLALLGAAFADPPVHYVATAPGPMAWPLALLAEIGDLVRSHDHGPARDQRAAADAAYRRVRGLPGRALHHRRGAGLGHEHEPGAHASPRRCRAACSRRSGSTSSGPSPACCSRSRRTA